jgi:hypothetical protein
LARLILFHILRRIDFSRTFPDDLWCGSRYVPVGSSFFNDFLRNDILLDNRKRMFFFCRWQRLRFWRFTEVAIFDRQSGLIEI